MNDKIYVGNGKEKSFQDGGSIIKIGFSAKDLETMKGHLNEKGYVNLNLSKRQEPSQYGDTHYLVIDTWKPSNDKNPHNMGSPSFNQAQRSSYDNSMDQQSQGQNIDTRSDRFDEFDETLAF